MLVQSFANTSFQPFFGSGLIVTLVLVGLQPRSCSYDEDLWLLTWHLTSKRARFPGLKYRADFARGRLANLATLRTRWHPGGNCEAHHLGMK